MWVVVKIMVPFWVPKNIRCRILIGIQKETLNVDNHPCFDYRSKETTDGITLILPPCDAHGC